MGWLERHLIWIVGCVWLVLLGVDAAVAWRAWLPVQVTGTLAGVIFGSGVAIFTQVVLNWYYRPKLRILRNNNVLPWGGDSFHRILVKNQGKKAAENCVGMITIDNAEADDTEQYMFKISETIRVSPLLGPFRGNRGRVSVLVKDGQQGNLHNQPGYYTVVRFRQVPHLAAPDSYTLRKGVGAQLFSCIEGN